MIGIGINENVFIQNAQLDEKGTLTITFDEAGAADRPKVDNPFDVLASDEHVETGRTGLDVRLFPPLPPKEGNDRTEEKNVELLVLDINKTKGVLLHLLRGYLTAEQIKQGGGINPFRGLAIDKNNFNKEVQKKEILLGIHRNMCTDFVQLAKPFFGKQDQTFRLLLVRQSKEKHFATFRSRFIEDNPFWESTDVPKEASKLKFTKYEVDNGLNDATPVAKPAAGESGSAPAAGGQSSGAPATGNGSAPVSAADIFG